MIRLFQIEWLKLKNYKVFWILLGLYLLSIVIVCSSGMFLMEFLKSKGAQFRGIDPTILPLYDFPDVWQNITYFATFFKVFLAFIVIISVTNEINYRTLRQNIIDGLSKWEFLGSKALLVLSLAILATIFLFFTGLVDGLIYSHVIEWKLIFSDLQFLAAYFLELITFMSLAFLLSVLLQKSGFVIVIIFMYTLIFEPFLTINIEHNPIFPGYLKPLVPFMPIKSLNNLVQIPFPKYVFMDTHDFVAFQDVVLVLGWLVIYQILIIIMLRHRDL